VPPAHAPLTTTLGGTIAAVYSRCRSQRDLRIRHGQVGDKRPKQMEDRKHRIG
jgi:hypothetical protein